MNSIDFGGHRSEVKAMIAIIYKCGVRGDATLCVVIFNCQHDFDRKIYFQLYQSRNIYFQQQSKREKGLQDRI